MKGKWLGVGLAGVWLAACGMPPQAPQAGRSELYLAERQVLFVLDERQGRVDAYALRNGIAHLGGGRLPAGSRAWHLSLAEDGRSVRLERSDGSALLLDGWHYALAPVAATRMAASGGGIVSALH